MILEQKAAKERKGRKGFREQHTEADVRGWFADYQVLRSFMKTAAKHGVSQGTVYTRLRELGLITVVPRSHELPPEKIEAMVLDYRRTRSLERTARIHNRTRQAVWDVLHRRGLTLPPKPISPAFQEWKGERFTPDSDGYYRSTSYASRQRGSHRFLQRVRWEELHGPVPKDRILIFKDKDKANCDPENMRCVTRAEARKLVKPSNGWMKFREECDRRSHELRAALAGGDAAVIAEAQLQYDALKAPDDWSAARRAKFKQWLKDQWANRTPEKRRAIFKKAVATRYKNRHAKMGSALGRLVEA